MFYFIMCKKKSIKTIFFKVHLTPTSISIFNITPVDFRIKLSS